MCTCNIKDLTNILSHIAAVMDIFDTHASILPPSNQEPDRNYEPLTTPEVEKAIKSLKNNKGAGPNNIPIEILKADIKMLAKACCIVS